eukprot:m.649696 g.649696  ORF g.649696 m.649696 type:complete len:221 (+) comp22665_c1_seq65:1854-2516(+)
MIDRRCRIAKPPMGVNFIVLTASHLNAIGLSTLHQRQKGDRVVCILKSHVYNNPKWSDAFYRKFGKAYSSVIGPLLHDHIVYLAPDWVSDDIFALYAAVKNGLDVKVISNDKFGDHQNKLMLADQDASTGIAFRKWLRGHQIHCGYTPKVIRHKHPRVVTSWNYEETKVPLPYDTVVQEARVTGTTPALHAWHIPEVGGTWLCVQQTRIVEQATVQRGQK